LKNAGAASVFLQFDGVNDDVYRWLRGRALWEIKQAAVAACAQAGLGVVLVPTLVPGVNTHAVGAILEAALAWYPAVRGVHFQPMSYFGRHPGRPTDSRRLTLPELMHAIETQSDGWFKVEHFRPPGCEHALCSFHAQYLLSEHGRPRPLHPLPMAGQSVAPIKAEEGARRAIDFVARQWAAPLSGSTAASGPSCACKEKIPESSNTSPKNSISLDDFLAAAQSRTFCVSAMAFQDVWNLDLERVQGCCIHVLAGDGRLIPFCLYNLTAADGRALYRP
ncbi:MAG: radical SAM protein, partial [Desulfobacteraceae bacterium]|nr:radical SAM protein [Desulfobacteraceae bacterium]